MVILNLKGNLIQWLIKKNFYLSNVYENIKVSKADKSVDKVLVYQMGKVASTSLYRTLQKMRLNASIYHLHVLQPAAIDRVLKSYKFRFPTIHRVDEHIVHSQYLRKFLNKGFDAFQSKWKIVTLVRDPAARNISKFFQENRYNPEFNELENCSEDQQKIDSLIQKYLRLYFNEKHPFTWFDAELSAVFNIDNPLNNFAASDGFKIYSYEHIDLLVLKLESLNECGEEALRQFFNVKNVRLVKANESAKREEQGRLYQKFKQRIDLPIEYLDRLYQFPQVQQVYSKDEIERFYNQWKAD